MNKDKLKVLLKMTGGALALIAGNYFFKLPNNFAFGGVTGIAIILAELTSWSVGMINTLINILFLILGFAVLGRRFGAKTVYVTLLTAGGLQLLEVFYPIAKPLTSQPVLDFTFAIILTAVGAGILFQCEASSGGFDILVLVLKKYTTFNVRSLLLGTELIVVVAAFFVFDIEVALYSFLGMIVKAILIDNTIASMNRCKYVHIICDDADDICRFIIEDLKKSATVLEAKGAYSHENKYIIMCVLRGHNEILLRRYINEKAPTAFILVSNTSEIFGKGFMPIAGQLL